MSSPKRKATALFPSFSPIGSVKSRAALAEWKKHKSPAKDKSPAKAKSPAKGLAPNTRSARNIYPWLKKIGGRRLTLKKRRKL